MKMIVGGREEKDHKRVQNALLCGLILMGPLEPSPEFWAVSAQRYGPVLGLVVRLVQPSFLSNLWGFFWASFGAQILENGLLPILDLSKIVWGWFQVCFPKVLCLVQFFWSPFIMGCLQLFSNLFEAHFLGLFATDFKATCGVVFNCFPTDLMTCLDCFTLWFDDKLEIGFGLFSYEFGNWFLRLLVNVVFTCFSNVWSLILGLFLIGLSPTLRPFTTVF